MIFAILTLLSALSLAATAGWFSIVGFMAIYAGAPIPALIMGVVTEAAKLITASWVYRNWKYIDWKLKAPLIYFILALMIATSIGVFGFLSKAHLEQSASTIDNSAKIEQLNYQINREKELIADNEKVIGQLDATVNSFLERDRTDRSLSVRRSQAPQRKQLQDESSESQKRIDTLNSEKFTLESEVRKMQLDVGPIRYIAELFYGVEENVTKNIESAVRIFTLLIVSTLDPLAVILLIAANHTLLRLKNGKDKETQEAAPHEGTDNKEQKAYYDKNIERVEPPPTPGSIESVQVETTEGKEGQIHLPIQEDPLEVINEETFTKTYGPNEDNFKVVQNEAPREEITSNETTIPIESKIKTDIPIINLLPISMNRTTIIKQPVLSRVIEHEKSTQNESEIRGTSGSSPQHFIPKKVDEMLLPKIQNNESDSDRVYKYPKMLSWLTEFKRS